MKTNKNNRNKWANTGAPLTVYKAFTLVELIVVITILAILGTIAFISLQGYSRDARDSKRTSDVNNLKTSLELFNVNTGEYPAPDSYTTITYSGGTDDVWYQGIAGDQVTTNLKQLNEKPLDPLTNSAYIYSVTNSYNEYEVLALYEGNVAYNPIINNANAATTTLTPKIVGNYNGVYVKTKHYIIPVPSIVTSEDIAPGIGKALTTGLIKSLVMTNGKNIPKTAVSQTNTGQLNINLSVYTGSITKNSADIQKLKVIQQIQKAYIGTSLVNNDNISNILNKKSGVDLVNLVNNIMSFNLPILLNKTVLNCGIIPGKIIYGTVDGSSGSLLTCGDDIIVCNGITGSGYTISACNIGATVTGESNLCIDAASCTTARVGYFYQFGRNSSYEEGTWTNGTPGYTYDWKSPGGINLGSANDWGVLNINKTTATYANSNSTDRIRMKGPCPVDYHIPTNKEWGDLYTAGLWGSAGLDMSNVLQLPMAGDRDWDGTGFRFKGISGRYWSSSPADGTTWWNNPSIGYNFYIDASTINKNNADYRAVADPIRCFKN